MLLFYPWYDHMLPLCTRYELCYFASLCFQVMVDGLARILCMRSEVVSDSDNTRQDHTVSLDGSHSKHGKERKKIKCPKLEYNKFQAPVFDGYREGGTSSRSHATPDYSPLHNQAIENDIKEIKRILRTFINRLNEKDAQGKVAKEWRIVARVLDRLFFFMYLCTIIVSLATIFPKAWNPMQKKKIQRRARHFCLCEHVRFGFFLNGLPRIGATGLVFFPMSTNSCLADDEAGSRCPGVTMTWLYLFQIISAVDILLRSQVAMTMLTTEDVHSVHARCLWYGEIRFFIIHEAVENTVVVHRDISLHWAVMQCTWWPCLHRHEGWYTISIQLYADRACQAIINLAIIITYSLRNPGA